MDFATVPFVGEEPLRSRITQPVNLVTQSDEQENLAEHSKNMFMSLGKLPRKFC